ncbi:LapA family protein [Arsukibacterium sp.]|uniref:LapA family protein n=1 Tax=Arsukibacterium sp. TaxID=1977258 RepID=UPI00299EEB48|nr:LapA family protein [Arsukibacterium sp.]MDX1677318.1 LapA family protein [Arsukibacterium sp.]
MSRLLYLILIIAFLIVGFVFGAINQQLTDVHFLIVKLQLRVVDVAIIFLITGVLLGLLIAAWLSMTRRTKNWFKPTAEKT